MHLREIQAAIAIQLVVIGSLLLDATGHSVPVVRQFAGFVFITFVPGFLILRILRIDRPSKIDLLLLSTGLSIVLVLSLGMTANALYPLLGITSPLSIVPIEITLALVTTVLCMLAYVRRGKDIVYARAHSLNWNFHFSRKDICLCLFLLSLPILSILDATLINVWDSDILALVFLALLPLVPILVGFNVIQKKLYPLAIVTVAISLLFHNSLVSNFLVEWGDGSFEYYFSNQVLTNSVWNSAVPSNFNAAPSTVILAPVFAQVCNLSLAAVFKILYPIVYSLVPLGIYQVVRKQTDEKVAFLASFLFTATYNFFTGSLGLSRFMVAMLFLVLFLIVFTEELANWRNVSLSVIFSSFVVISHYSLAAIFFVIIVLSMVLVFLVPKRRRARSYLTFGLFYSVFAFAWFTFISSGSVLTNLASIAESVTADFFARFLYLGFTQGLQTIVEEPKVPLLQVTKGLYLVAQILIVVGIVRVLLIRKFPSEKIRIDFRFLLLSLGTFIAAFAGIIIPHWAATINTTRLYHISLLFLAPFCVIGGVTAFDTIENLISRKIRRQFAQKKSANAAKAFSIFLGLYLIFSTGLVFELSGQPISFSLLSLNRSEPWRPHFNTAEIHAATWLNDHRVITVELRGDGNSAHLLLMESGVFYPIKEDANGLSDISQSENSYIFLGKEVVVDKLIRFPNLPGRLRGSFTAEPFLTNSTLYRNLMESNKVFDNGDVWIFYNVVKK